MILTPQDRSLTLRDLLEDVGVSVPQMEDILHIPISVILQDLLGEGLTVR